MNQDKTMFVLSALIAIMGTIGYHTFVKKTPTTINPVVSILAIYIFVIVICLIYLLLFHRDFDFLMQNARQVNWVQVVIAVSIFLMEMGFLLMYRYNWDLSIGNVVTGVFINLALLFIGVFFLKEGLSTINILGIFCCVVGVSLISLK